MKAYIGTKVVQAHREEKCTQTGSGPVVEQGYKVVYEDGYTSWSPKDVFERCYREITTAEADLVMGGDTPLAGIDLDKPNYGG